MPLRFIPREEGFFALFVKQADNVRIGAELLRDLLAGSGDRDSLQARILQLEHDTDELTHQIIRMINTTFVTPFDREDIHRLASQLDDVMDFIEAVADLLVLHSVPEPLPEMAKQADVLVRAAVVAHEALSKLKGFRGLEPYWVEIHRLENEGDRIYRRTVANLFSGDFKAMDVLKHKDLVDTLEQAVDGLENVANVIESIVLKHA
jgi:uncharacterized protein